MFDAHPKPIAMFLPPNKGKGLLIFLYLIVTVITCAAIFGAIIREHPAYKSPYDMYLIMGIALSLAAWLVHLTHKDYYRDNEGNKVFFEMEHHLFHTKMKYWTYIYLALAIVMYGNLFFHYFPPEE